MGANLVNLNVNPCKMCMPMGAVTAFYGIKNCMSILHGSQGCATYIRRHMATHFNEPVDIASSSLTEQGTVFGGEKNLMKGLENLIELYNPDVIGIATTCLAETIGEDVEAYMKKFHETHPEERVKLINVASAGYGGTQYEGFFRALRAIVSQVEPKTEKNDYINIITPMISPADTRWLKSLLDETGLHYILLPDLSENLDGISVRKYERLKSGGTSLEEISRMAGARFTIEFSDFVSEDSSPAAYLKEQFGVDYARMGLPAGIRAMDRLYELLEFCGGTITARMKTERGRYLDAMVDAHKYCAEGRAAIFGEPDFVLSATRLCAENGIVPVLTTTGSVCHTFKEKLEGEVQNAANRAMAEHYEILDDCDFDTIEKYCKELNVNLMIGSSDGRRVSHKLDIPLIRCAFPIHDRVGGQRVRTIGFDGSLFLMETAANLFLEKKETTFRQESYEKYYKDSNAANPPTAKENSVMDIKQNTPDLLAKTVEEKNATHPCFNCGAAKSARIHLPVAPKCNIQCNYCVRKFDCPNESRPGVTTEVLSPEQAYKKYAVVKAKVPNLTVVGIAGPGDSLANFEETKKTLQLIREYDPNVTFCLSTNGLMLPLYAQELIDLGVSHVTVTMNTVDPEIGAKIYHHVNYMGKYYTGVAAASILLANQLSGLKYLCERGVVCKVNCVTLKGINDQHLEEVSKVAKELGVYIVNVMPHIPVEGSAFESLDTLSNKEINEIRKKCGVNIKQMYHCRQCRADAIGTLENDQSIEFRGCSGGCSTEKEEKEPMAMLRFAVASKSGILVDSHFGHVEEFYIYESDGETVSFVEKRSVKKYCSGNADCDDHDDRMESILNAVADCNGVIALRIGESPSRKLAAKGIAVYAMYDKIEEAVKSCAKKQSVLFSAAK